MSRAHREGTPGILKHSMRDNYSEHGVDEYYKKVGRTYRNPHFPGVRNGLFVWLNQWWSKEHARIGGNGFIMLDLACGSGEATLSLMDWWKTGRALHTSLDETETCNADPRGKSNPFTPPPFGPTLLRPTVYAADPYTAKAFQARTGLYNCSELSFKDIAEGSLPQLPISSVQPAEGTNAPTPLSARLDQVIEMTICSFALHLIETPSELFALLWELSTKCRWLVVLAPHKKPEIKVGWGWLKWDVDAWTEVPMTESKGEILHARVHCRIYRSIHVQ
ncbi:hypothetical protein BC835DRAFT_600194 [Cytidiella melzeri]|nr:hypothetical protein BC835DRAFT_600194 [Cytidiella melzeri]